MSRNAMMAQTEIMIYTCNIELSKTFSFIGLTVTIRRPKTRQGKQMHPLSSPHHSGASKIKRINLFDI